MPLPTLPARRRYLGALLVGVAVLATSCTPAGYGAVATSTVRYPAVPVGPVDAVVVDGPTLATVPCPGCGAGQLPGFVSTTLPLGMVDGIADGRLGSKAAMGGLLQSGYWGGVRARDTGRTLAGLTGAESPLDPILAVVGTGGLLAVQHLITPLLDTAERGTPEEVTARANEAVVLHSAAAGFLRGFLEASVARPPAGASTAVRVECAERLSCRASGAVSAALTRLQPIAQVTQTPTGPEWAVVSATVAVPYDAALGLGADAWDEVRGQTAPAGFEEFQRSLAALMEQSEVTVLTAIDGLTSANDAIARRSLVLSAGWVVRLGTYALGLLGSSPAGTFPQPGV